MNSGALNKDRARSHCNHNVYIKGLCGNCGARLDPPQSSSVSMIHSVPELKVSEEYAKEIGKADQERLIEERKLVLLVDLDQTILHTTHEDPDSKKDPDVHSFVLWPGHPTYHTKLRPFLKEFLERMSKIYELHIFTFGCRRYAHKIASIIDPEQRYFGHRILSRDESVDQYSKKGNLNNLFPCGDAMVCIIDDRSDVWKDAGNLIQVKTYSYFKTSISDGAQRAATILEDDESLKRDADQLEALLGLSDSDAEETNEELTTPQTTYTNTNNQQMGVDSITEASVSKEDISQPSSPPSSPSSSSTTSSSSSSSSCSSSSSSKEIKRKRCKLSDSDSEDSKVNGKDNVESTDCDKEREKPSDFDDLTRESINSNDEVKFKSASLELDKEKVEDIEQKEESKQNQDETNQRSPSPMEDLDDHLLHLPEILERIHDKWYMELDEQRSFLVDGESYKLPDIKDIIKRYLRKRY